MQISRRSDFVKKKILFLCTANSCRSQLAEGIANHFLGDLVEAASAGTEASFVNPRATTVLKEIGVDISSHRSKCLDEFAADKFDYVITLCGDANEKCPLFFGGVQRIHIGFPDPAKATGSEAEILDEFRKVRDQIKMTLLDFITKELEQNTVAVYQ
jgi:arsenate reductase (thioredoxin)